MKYPLRGLLIIVLFILFAPISGMGQSVLVGTWKMTQFISETLEEKKLIGVKEIQSEGLIWDMIFHPDGTFEQAVNMNDRKEMDRIKGTWELEEEDRLIVRIPARNGKILPIKYFYDLEGQVLTLERYNPMRTLRLVLTFNKEK